MTTFHLKMEEYSILLMQIHSRQIILKHVIQQL